MTTTIPTYIKNHINKWSWLTIHEKEENSSDHDDFYSYTYGFGNDDWSVRIGEGADDDECNRMLYIYKLCFKYNFSLSKVWKDIHQYVVCPLFKKVMSEDLNEKYVSYPAKKYEINKNELEIMWKNIDDNMEPSDEENFILKFFYRWILEDIKYNYNLSITNNIVLSEIKYDKIENNNEIENNKVEEKIIKKKKIIFKPKKKIEDTKIEDIKIEDTKTEDIKIEDTKTEDIKIESMDVKEVTKKKKFSFKPKSKSNTVKNCEEIITRRIIIEASDSE
jgi:hypothetical protein